MAETSARRKRLAVTLAGAATLVAPFAAAEIPSFSFKDWVAVCDNVRTCTAIGLPPEDDPGDGGGLVIERGGEPGAEPRVSVILQDEDNGRRTLRLVMDGRPLATVAASAGEAKLDAAQSRTVLDAVPMGIELEVMEGEKRLALISMRGSSAALRWIDGEQRRADTVTALVAKGRRPASAVPAPPGLPAVRPAPAAAQTNLPKAPPAFVAAEVRDCDADNLLKREKKAHRLGPDAVLWLIPCGDGAYNFSERVIIADGRGEIRPEAWTEDDPYVINAEYDPKTQELHQYSKGRGLGDCGITTTWVWTGREFVKTEESFMPVCRGLYTFWPTTHRARVSR